MIVLFFVTMFRSDDDKNELDQDDDDKRQLNKWNMPKEVKLLAHKNILTKIRLNNFFLDS